MAISDGVLRRGRNTLLDLHNSSYDTQPHSLIVNYLLVLQKRTLRLIYFAQPRDHAIPFFIKSNCLPLQSLFFQQSSYLMYDVHTKTAAKSLLNKFAKSVQNIIIIRDYPQRNVCLLISLELKK